MLGPIIGELSLEQPRQCSQTLETRSGRGAIQPEDREDADTTSVVGYAFLSISKHDWDIIGFGYIAMPVQFADREGALAAAQKSPCPSQSPRSLWLFSWLLLVR